MTVDFDKFQSYSNYLDSYKKSIKTLYQAIESQQIAPLDAVFPLFFLIRHFLEIGYKGNIYDLARTTGIPHGLNKPTHHLPTLHTSLKNQFTAAAIAAKMTKAKTKEFNKYFRKLSELVKQFEKIDHAGVTFRYPDPNKKNAATTPGLTLDVKQTYKQFDEAKELLIYLQDFMVGNLKKFDEEKNSIWAGGIWSDNGIWQDGKKLTSGI
jgi:hypothetical protein